jgi:hypothetical protein
VIEISTEYQIKIKMQLKCIEVLQRSRDKIVSFACVFELLKFFLQLRRHVQLFEI